MHQRKAEMAKHSDAFIALPGWYKLQKQKQKQKFSLTLKSPKQIMKTWRPSGAFIFLILASKIHHILSWFFLTVAKSSLNSKEILGLIPQFYSVNWYKILKGPISWFLSDWLITQDFLPLQVGASSLSFCMGKKSWSQKKHLLILLKDANQVGIILIHLYKRLLEVEKGIYHEKLWKYCTLYCSACSILMLYMVLVVLWKQLCDQA